MYVIRVEDDEKEIGDVFFDCMCKVDLRSDTSCLCLFLCLCVVKKNNIVIIVSVINFGKIIEHGCVLFCVWCYGNH